jgi:predicted Zn finger-like uncharacterized protein
MQITCPSCAADYEVPASRLTPRRMVRCARCAGQWVPDHPDDDAVPREPAEHSPSDLRAASLPSMTAMDRLAASPAPRPLSAALLGAWVLTVVVLVGALAATVTWRAAVIRTWPASALILEPFGQAVPPLAQTSGNAQTSGKKSE